MMSFFLDLGQINSRTIHKYIVLLVALQFSSCSRENNNPEANLRYVGNKTFLKLKGRRYLMTHDLLSVAMRKTYEDSILFELSSIEGIIPGSKIPVMPGYYKYEGYILIDKEKVKVNLFYDNYDDRTKDPVGWNGVYTIAK